MAMFTPGSLLSIRSRYYAHVYGDVVMVMASRRTPGPLGSMVTLVTFQTRQGVVEWGAGFLDAVSR